MKRIVRVAQVFFLLSGITGLIYEVLWTRRLTLTFGHTVLAVSTVLTAYMSGLAIGSLAGGRWADRHVEAGGGPSTLLSAYGKLEIFVGLWAVLTLPLLGLVERLYLTLARGGLTGAPLYLACFAGSMLVLIPPTAAMGATLPVMSRVLVNQVDAIGPLLARLYGLNTVGAFLGSVCAGFILLPLFGLWKSLCGAAAVNLLIGAGAWRVGGSGEEGASVPETHPVRGGTGGRSILVPLAFGVAGAASMTYQLGWTRGLVLTFGSSTYAFSTILAAFLAGLGLGSILYGRIMGGLTPRIRHLALLQLGIGLLGGLTILLMDRLPLAFLATLPFVGESFVRALGVQFTLAFGLLVLPTFLMGLMFPLASHLYTRNLTTLGKSIGEVYSANTLGCIVGSFLGGFVLIPLMGAQWTLKIAVLLNLAVAAGLLLEERVGGNRAYLAFSLTGMLLVAFVPRWNPGLMSAGVGVYFQRYLNKTASEVVEVGTKPAFYKDGLSCTVSVHINSSTQLSMRVNGKSDASLGRPDLQTMNLIGLIPALLHPKAERAAVIGLGSGITVNALSSLRNIRSVICAELEPAVVEAQRYWKGYNGDILARPEVSVKITDGRTFVLGSPEKFDIIASEPSNPWIAGIGNLFTKNFYEECLDRLRPGGLMAQWVHLYNMSEYELGMVVRTFFEVFPHGTVWQTSGGDLLLIGAAQPVKIDPASIRETVAANPEMGRLMPTIGLYHPDMLLGHFLLTRESAVAAFSHSPLNTDDLPLLEFSAPTNLYRQGQADENVRLLRSLPIEPLPPGIEGTPELMTRVGFGWVNVRNFAGVDQLLKDPSEFGERALLRVRLAQEVFPDGVESALETALREQPDNPLALAFQAESLRESGRWLESLGFYEKALAKLPWESLGIGYGVALRESGELEASRSQLHSVAQSSKQSLPWTELARTLYAQGKPGQAVEAFSTAYRVNPSDVDAVFGIGFCRLAQEQLGPAEEYFLQALSLVPDHQGALFYSGLLEERQSDLQKAAWYFRKVLELNPEHAGAAERLRNL